MTQIQYIILKAAQQLTRMPPHTIRDIIQTYQRWELQKIRKDHNARGTAMKPTCT